jgi:hypothetical protein
MTSEVKSEVKLSRAPNEILVNCVTLTRRNSHVPKP